MDISEFGRDLMNLDYRKNTKSHRILTTETEEQFKTV
jgi:hypothetical protein